MRWKKDNSEPIASLEQHGIRVSLGNNGGCKDKLLKGYMHHTGVFKKQGIWYYKRCLAVSIPGTMFCIHIGYEFPEDDGLPGSYVENANLQALVWIDGIFVADGDYPVDRANPEFEINQGKEAQPFCFSEREFKEGDLEGAGPDLECIGVIEVNVQWCRQVDSPENTRSLPDNPDPKLLTVPVPEENVKANCGVVGHLGPAPDPKPDAVDDNRYTITSPVDDKIYAFFFEYHSPEFLVAKDVAPSSILKKRRQPTPRHLSVKKEEEKEVRLSPTHPQHKKPSRVSGSASRSEKPKPYTRKR